MVPLLCVYAELFRKPARLADRLTSLVKNIHDMFKNVKNTTKTNGELLKGQSVIYQLFSAI